MRENMIMNVASVAFGSIAIAVGCFVSKSAWPLCAFLLLPKWSYSSDDDADQNMWTKGE